MKIFDLIQVLTSGEEYIVFVIDKDCNLIVKIKLYVKYDSEKGRKIASFETLKNVKDCFVLDMKKLLNANVFRIGLTYDSRFGIHIMV